MGWSPQRGKRWLELPFVLVALLIVTRKWKLDYLPGSMEQALCWSRIPVVRDLESQPRPDLALWTDTLSSLRNLRWCEMESGCTGWGERDGETCSPLQTRAKAGWWGPSATVFGVVSLDLHEHCFAPQRTLRMSFGWPQLGECFQEVAYSKVSSASS